MALQGSFTDRFGQVHSTAYARIERITFDRDSILAIVKIYVSNAARASGFSEVAQFREVLINSPGSAISLLENQSDILAAAYNRLQNNVARYSGWVDV